jgi:MFS family permease
LKLLELTILTTSYYFPIILTENIGLSEFMARVLTGCNATSYMISSALCFWMIERFGRRQLMLGGLGLQCLAYVMVSIAVGSQSTAPFEWGAVAITFLFFYYAAFGCTWGMVPWVYQAEINSLAMRTIGSASATSTNWLFGFVCTQFTPTGIRNIGFRFYISKYLDLSLTYFSRLTMRSLRHIQPSLRSNRILPLP